MCTSGVRAHRVCAVYGVKALTNQQRGSPAPCQRPKASPSGGGTWVGVPALWLWTGHASPPESQVRPLPTCRLNELEG